MERSPPIEDDETWFGDRRVETSEKPRLVRGVFESVAGRYDLMNDLMSGGIHRLWKAAMIDWLAPAAGPASCSMSPAAPATSPSASWQSAADGRPGRRLRPDPGHAGGRPRPGHRPRAFSPGIDWMAGDAEALPFADRSVDAYTIAFGLRNVTDIDKALAEARRVLKPGGRFLCLEFSQVRAAACSSSSTISIPSACCPGWGGSWRATATPIAIWWRASAASRPSRSWLSRIAAAGLERTSYRNLSGGIAALHSAWRI